MKENLLIRNVSPAIRSWLERERHQQQMTQNEFLLKILERAVSYSAQPSLFDDVDHSIPPSTTEATLPFTFIDLFSGIGGLRIGLERAGGSCLFSCEWDKYSQKTYKAWFGELPHGDIRAIDPASIPDHDLLAAGFPCQPFSIAGVSKKNSLGRAHGFQDAAQGTLFYNVATIAAIKRPPVLLLENVKNLLSHDGGRTYKVISATLKDLDYVIFNKVIDAADYVPQHRERIFIVCFDKHIFGNNPPFQFPKAPEPKPKFKDILESEPDQKYTLSDHLWKYLQDYAQRHREKGNGFGFGLTDLNGVSRTLSARYYKDGSEILIPQGKHKNPRRLTPREAARIMGFEDSREIVVSDTQAYKQFGNAVVPPVAEAIAKEIVKTLRWHITNCGSRCLVKGRNPSIESVL